MENLASFIDHTILKADTTEKQVLQICQEAITYGFATVCVNPYYVAVAKKALIGSSVGVTSVIGFPLGCTMKEVKAFETKMAVNSGADELDMVINISALKNRDLDVVYEDIVAVVEAADGKIVKVIIETGYLSDEEKKIACQMVKKAGADFVKTSTGFGQGGATEEDVTLMQQLTFPEVAVKASGGIRDYETAIKMIEAGATRLGTSASVSIVTGDKNSSNDY